MEKIKLNGGFKHSRANLRESEMVIGHPVAKSALNPKLGKEMDEMLNPKKKSNGRSKSTKNK
jgi:hypothetical protein